MQIATFQRMRGRSSGVEVALGKHAWVTTFRDGLMVRHKLYMNQSEALEAAGLGDVGDVAGERRNRAAWLRSVKPEAASTAR